MVDTKDDPIVDVSDSSVAREAVLDSIRDVQFLTLLQDVDVLFLPLADRL
jgi:hypothetical protein